jgi:hypothetical protein
VAGTRNKGKLGFIAQALHMEGQCLAPRSPGVHDLLLKSPK